MTLPADRNAPSECLDKSLGTVADHREVKRLSKEPKKHTEKLKVKYGAVSNGPSSDSTRIEKAFIDKTCRKLKDSLPELRPP